MEDIQSGAWDEQIAAEFESPPRHPTEVVTPKDALSPESPVLQDHVPVPSPEVRVEQIETVQVKPVETHQDTFDEDDIIYLPARTKTPEQRSSPIPPDESVQMEMEIRPQDRDSPEQGLDSISPEPGVDDKRGASLLSVI